MKKKRTNQLNAGGGTMVAEEVESRKSNGESQKPDSGPSTPLKERIAAAPELRAPWTAIQRSGTNPRKTFNLEGLESAGETGIVSALWVRPLPQFELQAPDMVTDTWRIVLAPEWVARNGDQGSRDSHPTEVNEYPATMENMARMELESRNRFQYELIAGERRHRKAEQLDIEVPIKVIDCTPDEAWKLQRIENLQREDITPLEEAQDFRASVDSGKWGDTVDRSVKAIAADIGCSWQHIYDRMALLKLSEAAREAFIGGKIDISQAKEISTVPDEKMQAKLLKEQAENEYSVRRLREVIAEDYMRPLEDAPFDQDNAALVTIAKDCASCPKRTGNMLGEHPHLKTKPNYCTDPKCFTLKENAHRELQFVSYREKGFRVLTAKESKPLFEHWNPSEPARRCGWKLANTVPAEDKKERTFKQLGKLVEIQPAVCCDGNGKVVEVMELAPLVKALLDKKIIKAPQESKNGVRPVGDLALGYQEKVETSEERIQRLMEREVEAQLTTRTVGLLVAAVEKKSEKKLAEVLRALLLEKESKRGWASIFTRRGWAEDGTPLSDRLKTTEEMLGFLFETTLMEWSDYNGEEIEQACTDWTIDGAKLEKEVRAEVKEQFKLPKDGEEIEVPRALVEEAAGKNSCAVGASSSTHSAEPVKLVGAVEFRGRRWACQGSSSGPEGNDSASLILLVPKAEYKGKCGTDAEINGANDGSEAETYIGVIVQHEGKEWVQSKPEVEIKPDAPLEISNPPAKSEMVDRGVAVGHLSGPVVEKMRKKSLAKKTKEAKAAKSSKRSKGKGKK